MTKERFNMLVGSIGAFIGVFVFLAYIPQIIANLHGQPSQPWQPLFAKSILFDLGIIWLDKIT